MWGTLEYYWQACLEEVWEAYRLGSLPVGAVIVNGRGDIIGRGRNRTREATGHPIAGNRLAHAEVNALLSADFSENPPEDCTLYVTTEPCPLCVGAMVMSNVKTVAFASRDPWSGASDLLAANPYMRSQQVRATGPTNPKLENILVALQVAWHMRGKPHRYQPVLDAWMQIAEAGVTLGQELHETGELADWIAEGKPIEVVIGQLTERFST